jgi:hypothetical protein
LKGKNEIPEHRYGVNTNADQWWLVVRCLLLGLSFALFVMQHVPSGSIRSATIEFDEVARSTYLSVYLMSGDKRYAILVDNEKVNNFLYKYRDGGTVAALLRPGNGIVELWHSDTLLYSYEDYRRLYLEPKKKQRRWMYFTLALFFSSLIIRRI